MYMCSIVISYRFYKPGITTEQIQTLLSCNHQVNIVYVFEAAKMYLLRPS